MLRFKEVPLILLKAMVDLDNYLEKNNLKSAIILQVHDELILEVPNNEVEIIKKFYQR